MLQRVSLRVTATCLLAAGALLAQTAAAPAFDVASVKPSALDLMKLAQQLKESGQMPKIGAHVEGLRAEYTFMSLKDLIAEAYKVKDFQITGPDWVGNLNGQRFDIQAKMPDGATKDQAPRMLQTLLAERFKLAVHRDESEHPVLALVVGKGGPKLKESPAGADQDFDPASPLKPGEQQMDTPEGPVRMSVDATTGSTVVNMGKRGKWTEKVDTAAGSMHLEASQTTMSAFADLLTSLTRLTGGPGTQVLDMTELKGNYVVAIDFSLADLLQMVRSMGIAVPSSPNAASGAPADLASEPAGASSVFNAVQALGLKLESRKAPTLQLVIDHAEKMPTEN